MFKTNAKKHLPLLLLVLANLIIGLLIVPDFGESVDEISQNSYSERTIQTIQAVITNGFTPDSFIDEAPEQGSHGPAFIVTVTLLRRLLLPGRSEIEKLYFNHFLYFLVFQVGIVSIFFLARRWVSETAAFGVALLFNSQPILFGHAFMNPKDVVFMSLLTASAALGFWMLDRGEASQPTANPLSGGIRAFGLAFLRYDVWLAALVLGFSSAIRIAGPVVAMILFAYILLRQKWQLLPKFLAYGLISFCFMVIFWPYLWPDPFSRLVGSILDSAHYPSTHLTLFNGVVYDSTNIPSFYLPVLLMLQLTIPMLLLVLAGAFYALKHTRREFIALVLIWFVLPVTVVILARVSLYNNFRQLFFILPPLFIVAGMGLDGLLTLVKRPALRYLMLFLILLPGLYANITLHPYQYVYYNELIGGVKGAYRQFDLDYWNLAYKDAQLYLNQAASPSDSIYVYNTKNLAQKFARPGLVFNEFGSKNWMRYQFIMVSTAMNADQRFKSFPTAFAVERDGVPLTYIKKPKPMGQ